MKFLVRDDDASAMTRPEDLQNCYQHVWDAVPICLSVTPFRIPGRTTGVPESLIGSEAILPLAECEELLGFLRDQIARGRIDIALHGYHHNRPSGLPEFVGGEALRQKALEGRHQLEELFGRSVRTFVPPNNQLSAAGFDAVVSAGMNIVNNQTRARLIPPWTGFRAAAEAVVAARYALEARLGKPNTFRIRRFPGYQQAPYYTVGPDSDLATLQSELTACYQANGVFVLATHYHAFPKAMRSGETIRDGVMRLIDQAAAWDDVQFVDYERLW